MLFRYFISILLVIVVGACSDKVSENAYPNSNSQLCVNSPASCVFLDPTMPNDLPGVDPKDIDDYIFDPNISTKNYAQGAVVPFEWQNTLPWYYETENYPYGFDKDPMSNWLELVETSKDVYVSVAEGELASVILKIPSEYDAALLSLVNEDGAAICVGGSCNGEMVLNAGNYILKYNGIDQERYLHVVSYAPKSYEITYVQFDKEDGTSCTTDEGCYTKNSVEANFNRIFSQAVVSGSFTEKSPSDYELEKSLELDMTDPFSMDEYFGSLTNKILSTNQVVKDYFNAVYYRENAEESCNEYGFGCETLETLKSMEEEKARILVNNGARYAFAYNNVRLVWRLNQQLSSDLRLNNYKPFMLALITHNEAIGSPDNTVLPMYLKSYSNACENGVGLNPVPVLASFGSYDESNETISVAISNQIGQHVDFDPECDYLYVDTYSFVPGDGLPLAKGSVAQVTYPLNPILGVVAAGVTFAPRRVGESSQNTIVHELGHTFGLKDLYIDPKDPAVPYCLVLNEYGRYSTTKIRMPDGSLGDYFDKEKCAFVTDEADLMNYAVPTGPRLRYRPLPIVSTGTNNGLGNYDSQWECLQNAICGGVK